MDFAPSVYEHSAALIGKTPWEVSRDAHLLYQAQAEGFRMYAHAPVVVGIDIYNLEAEAYGGVIEPPTGTGIPALRDAPCADLDAVASLDPLDPASAGRLAMVIAVGRRLKATFHAADVRVPLSGPFSIAVCLLGFEELLIGSALHPDRVRAALSHLVTGQLRFCQAIRDAGLDIAFFESAVSPPLLSPAMFRDIAFGPLMETISGAAEIVGHPVPCIIGGNTTPILLAIIDTGTKYVICPSETDQPHFMEIMAGHPDVMVRVNMNPGIVSAGTWEQIRDEVDRIFRITTDRENVCLGTGALPYETPPENVLRIKDYVAQKTDP